MEPDSYKIEVIHYLDPHLIWIVVRDPSVVKNEFLFEQIGVFGLLPLEKALSILTDDLKVLKCEEWLPRGRPAAAAVIKDLLEESDEVWFSPMLIDRRTSIFDDNIHKYGDIIFKTKNGKFKKLSEQLIKSGFAYINVYEFNEKLSNGQLKTKLNATETEEVIRNLKNYCLELKDKPNNKWKKSVLKQTSVFHMYKEFELSLTEAYLEILESKFKDFELCKGVEEQSVGRACRRKKNPPGSDKQELKSQFSSKRLSAYKKLSNLSETENLEQTYNDVGKFLAANSNVEDLNQTDESQSTSENNTRSEIDAVSAKENKESFINWKLQKAKKSVDQEFECDVSKVERNVAAEVGEKTNYDKFKEEKVHTHKTSWRSGKSTDKRSSFRVTFGTPGMEKE